MVFYYLKVTFGIDFVIQNQLLKTFKAKTKYTEYHKKATWIHFFFTMY